MTPLREGPSDNAWGKELCDPVVVSHQSRLVLFARAAKEGTGTLYFQVLDPAAAATGPDASAWNGWYHFSFPESAVKQLPQNTEYEVEQSPPELRLAGMDLLTVTPTATQVAPSDASFQVQSDGVYLSVYRPSAHGTLYLNRLLLLDRKEEVDGETVQRFWLEPAWEVRYRRSRVRDVPLDDTDGQSFLDPVGEPFIEPALEFGKVTGIEKGRFGLAKAPTSDAEVSVLYVAVATATGVQLHQIRRSSVALTDYTDRPITYTPIVPSLKSGGAALTPIPGLAPALAFYAEQEAARSAEGDESELQRAGHLMLAIPVTGGGLDVAMAIYDFALDRDGNIPDLPANEQSLVLVDGTLSGGTFTPDNSAPVFPTPADLPKTVQMIDGLLVSSMVLGQVRPHGSPMLYVGDDGLVHLYFGGPLPTETTYRWGSLDPTLPQAMVAQFDARANRLTLAIPWKISEPSEQPNGSVDFVARQSGSIMEGTTVTVSEVKFGAEAQDDLCTVAVTYSAASGLPAETWIGVPRELGAFMFVLNGDASDDSADPDVLSGVRPFFDFSGTLPLVRVPIIPAPHTSVGFDPVLTFVSTRTDVPLRSLAVSASGNEFDFTFTFEAQQGVTLSVTWKGVPADPRKYADVFDGAAGAATYAYPSDPSNTPLFALTTDAVEVDTPLLLYSTGANPNVASLTIEVKASSTQSGKLDVTFDNAGNKTEITGVPAAAADFAAHLLANHQFQGLGLGISSKEVAGRIKVTGGPVGQIGLAGTAALFDLVLPNANLAGASPATGSRTAGTQSHTFDPPGKFDITRLIGLFTASLLPEGGAPAFVQNATAASHAVTRPLHAQVGSGTPLYSGVWVRQRPQQQCSFDGTDSVTVPVVSGNAARPESINLRPQWDWTLEAWFKPTTSQHQRLLTFLDNKTPVPAGAPSLAYEVALQGQRVIEFDSYNKVIGTPDSSFFQTGTSTKADFMPTGAFTWECWLKPDAQAAPPPASGVTPLGGLLQVGQAGRTAFLTFGLTADRRVVLVTLDDNSTAHTWTSTGVIPAVDDDGDAIWSHLAIVGVQDNKTKNWSLKILVDAQVDETFTGVQLQNQPGAFLTIGANTPDNASLFGKMAQLRYWKIARSAADIRRTWLTSLSGYEPGLLGNWPLTAIETDSIGKFVRNTAAVTTTDWDAYLDGSSKQKVQPAADSFFLSVIASVGGLEAVEADALLANGQWNHLGLIYRAGGAVDMNPADRYDNGRYDWINCGPAESLGPAPNFAIDAWLEIPANTPGEIGTIMARWAFESDPEDQCYRLWIDSNGELNLSVAVVTDKDGTLKVKTLTSSGANLKDGVTHHIAAVFSSKSADPENEVDAEYTITLYKDGSVVGTKTDPLSSVDTIEVNSTQNDVTVGRAFPPAAGGTPLAAEDFYYLRGKLGQLQFWSTAADVKALFPERYPRIPRHGAPKGLTAQWAFREQAGLFAADSIGGIEARLNTSSMWSSLAATSEMSFTANGTLIGTVSPYHGTLPPTAVSQFTMGLPLGLTSGGFEGEIAQISLWEEARSLETIQDQQFVPLLGDERGLIACWNFLEGGIDITGGQNNADPPVPASRLSISNAPLSNEGPYVRNVYGGVISELSQSAPGLLAVGSYADAQDIGTTRQRAVLKRQYILDPDQSIPRGIQIGELDLTYIGQVQTEPTLLGYIEGAPPVPSENLTRPYYLSPGGAPYVKYLDTATVTLTQEAAEEMTISSASSHATQIDTNAAIGIMGIKNMTNLNLGAGPFSISTNSYDAKGIAQLRITGFGEFGGSDSTALHGAWTGTQRDTMGVSGDWEPFQPDPEDYFNPTVGRRFVPDNLGYALVESLTADLYAMTFRPTKASLSTIILPNLAIPPDRNIILYPMNNQYTKAGTLDGKIGLMNDLPDYPDADIKRGSYFRPVEAYKLAAKIDQQRNRAEGFAAQFDAESRARGWETDLEEVKGYLPQDFDQEPADAVAIATPSQGIANRYVWTADGGLHAEEQRTSASVTRSYTGTAAGGGGGGFHADGEFFFKLGFAWSFDVMATHRVDVQVSKATQSEQIVGLEVTVEGEAYLRAYDPNAKADYGSGTGNFLPGAAPGKVKAYRFMTIYLPPSVENGAHFDRTVDPVWKRLSNSPMARAIRETDTSGAIWRILHRVTYIERVPPLVSSRPLYVAANNLRAPVNVEGNAELIRLVNAQFPAQTKEYTRLVVGNAVAKALNPAPTAPGQYPQSALEKTVPWWRTFLDLARPNGSGEVQSQEAAALLRTLVTRSTSYLYAGFVLGAFESILGED